MNQPSSGNTLAQQGSRRPGQRSDTDSKSWLKCPSCDAFVYLKRLQKNLKVCPECNYHFRLTSDERLAQLLDPGSFERLGAEIKSADVLGFVDSKPYSARLEAAARKTGLVDAAMYGTGRIGGLRVVVAIMDFGFMGGSMGAAVGEVVTQAAELALASATTLLLIAASGGARMQEGCVSLMQMAKTGQALARLHEAGILSICLNTDPTFGGVTASFATLGDVLISEPRSLVGFAGPSVIENTIRQKLPKGFQTAEFLLNHGMLDLVETRAGLRQVIRKLLAFHQAPPGAIGPTPSGAVPVTDPGLLRARPAWEVVVSARDLGRPTTLEYVAMVFDDFQELHGDRLYADNSAIVGGLALLDSLPVVVIGHQKGHNTSDLVERNFAMPEPEGYRKALRLMRYAAKFSMPLITFVDTPGAFPGQGAEERGQGQAIASCIMEMSRLPVPTVAIVTGEGGSGGALALAVADRVLMMENAYYSVISPEGCSTILWGDATAAPQAAAALRITAPDLLRLKVMDAIVREPEGGAQNDWVSSAANLKSAVIANLHELVLLQPDERLEARYRRFRAFGDQNYRPVLDPGAQS